VRTAENSSYISPSRTCQKPNHYNYDIGSPLEGYRPRLYESIYSNRGGPYYHSPYKKNHLSTQDLRDKYPENWEMPPNRDSPVRESFQHHSPNLDVRYLVELEAEKAFRLASDKEHELHEAEVHRRWVEEDARRLARNLQSEDERNAWEANENARRDCEQMERDSLNSKQADRRDRDRLERDLYEQERRDRELREKMQREDDLERHRRQTEDTLNQDIRPRVEAAKRFEQRMPTSYNSPGPANARIADMFGNKKGESLPKPRGNSKIKGLNQFTRLMLENKVDDDFKPNHMRSTEASFYRNIINKMRE
jgi:hypothetical protein